jgi:hypothetical protein
MHVFLMLWLLQSTPSDLKDEHHLWCLQAPAGCKAWVCQVYYDDLSLGEVQGQVLLPYLVSRMRVWLCLSNTMKHSSPAFAEKKSYITSTTYQVNATIPLVVSYFFYRSIALRDFSPKI